MYINVACSILLCQTYCSVYIELLNVNLFSYSALIVLLLVRIMLATFGAAAEHLGHKETCDSRVNAVCQNGKKEPSVLKAAHSSSEHIQFFNLLSIFSDVKLYSHVCMLPVKSPSNHRFLALGDVRLLGNCCTYCAAMTKVWCYVPRKLYTTAPWQGGTKV